MNYLTLFYVFFKIGIFGFGGGYAILSLIQHEVVDIHQWMALSDFTDIIAISQVTPGPIAINCATYVGYSTTQSIIGAIIATLGVSLPSLIIMVLISKFIISFRKNKLVSYAFWGLKPAVLGLLASAALLLANPDNFIDTYSYLIFTGVFAASLFKVNPIFLILLSGLLGFLLY